MGIEISQLHFLMSSQKTGVSFYKTVTIGRQDLLLRPNKIKDIFSQYSLAINDDEIELILNSHDHFAEPLFTRLGAETIDSIDYTSFEGASIVHDMNQPLPDALKNSYSLVFDGGTLEHVFNFPQSVKNCMEMVKVGGHFISVTPCNNMMGHGFYQFSPELFYRIFSEENGFIVENMVINEGWGYGPWLKVADPDKIKKRVGCLTIEDTNLYMCARKVKDVPIFKTTPYQSDYSTHWESANDREHNVGRLDFFYKSAEPRKTMMGKVIDCLPVKIRNTVRTAKRKLTIAPKLDQTMFKEIELE